MSKIKKLGNFGLYHLRSTRDTIGMGSAIVENTVIVNIQYPLKFRYFYRLLDLLRTLGYRIYIYLPTTRSLYNLARMDGGLDLLPNLQLISRLPKWIDQATYCSDSQDKFWNDTWQKKILVEFKQEKPIEDVINPIFIPYSVHDYIHRTFWKDREALLRNPRNIRMLFAGAYHGYAGKGISTILGKMERQEIVELYGHHPNTIVIESQDQLTQILNAPATRNYYWVDQDRFRIPAAQWLEVLSHTEVFLCPPGVVNPMSHNANEAMAMGAIPLINYPEWFHPHLRDGENCLIFSTKEELSQYLGQIAEYSAQELSVLRGNILHYFNVFQSDAFLLKKMQAYADQRMVTFVMNVEQEILNNPGPDSIALSPDNLCASS